MQGGTDWVNAKGFDSLRLVGKFSSSCNVERLGRLCPQTIKKSCYSIHTQSVACLNFNLRCWSLPHVCFVVSNAKPIYCIHFPLPLVFLEGPVFLVKSHWINSFVFIIIWSEPTEETFRARLLLSDWPWRRASSRTSTSAGARPSAGLNGKPAEWRSCLMSHTPQCLHCCAFQPNLVSDPPRRGYCSA